MIRKKRELVAKQLVEQRKLKLWHVDYHSVNPREMAELNKLSEKDNNDIYCSELTDEPRLMCFML